MEKQENQQQCKRQVGGVECKESTVNRYFEKVTRELDTWVEDDGDKRAYILMIYDEVGKNDIDEENKRIASGMYSSNGKVKNAIQLVRNILNEENSPLKKVILGEAARNIKEKFFNEIKKMAGR